MAAVADWKLRRLSSRAIRVYERHSTTEPAIAALGHSLIPAILGFNEAYEESRAHRVSRARAMGTGLEAVGGLHRRIRSWLGPLAKDIPGFEEGLFVASGSVPDDVITRAEQLLRTTDRAVADGVVLPYVESLHADLEPAIAAAQAEWDAAGTSRAHQTTLMKAVREAAATLKAELVAFRRTLRASIGTSHPDFQKLRANRVSTPDQEDDEVAASLPEAQGKTPTAADLAEAS